MNPFPPATTLVVLMLRRLGDGSITGNSAELEEPPPGRGLNTNTTPVPPKEMSDGRILDVSCVELT
jgi:hypothetical protein